MVQVLEQKILNNEVNPQGGYATTADALSRREGIFMRRPHDAAHGHADLIFGGHGHDNAIDGHHHRPYQVIRHSPHGSSPTTHPTGRNHSPGRSLSPVSAAAVHAESQTHQAQHHSVKGSTEEYHVGKADSTRAHLEGHHHSPQVGHYHRNSQSGHMDPESSSKHAHGPPDAHQSFEKASSSTRHGSELDVGSQSPSSKGIDEHHNARTSASTNTSASTSAESPTQTGASSVESSSHGSGRGNFELSEEEMKQLTFSRREWEEYMSALHTSEAAEVERKRAHEQAMREHLLAAEDAEDLQRIQDYIAKAKPKFVDSFRGRLLADIEKHKGEVLDRYSRRTAQADQRDKIEAPVQLVYSKVY